MVRRFANRAFTVEPLGQRQRQQLIAKAASLYAKINQNGSTGTPRGKMFAICSLLSAAGLDLTKDHVWQEFGISGGREQVLGFLGYQDVSEANAATQQVLGLEVPEKGPVPLWAE